MYIVISILAFGILIAIHELGHFIAAKSCNVRVDEFSIGMGPALFKRQRGETLYALRVLPIGGYCAMAGEDEESDDPRAFTNQNFIKRTVILCAGSFMNFVLGLVLILIMYSSAKGFYTPVIDKFVDNCPYESSEGLNIGDELYKIDGSRVFLMTDVQTLLAQGGERHDIVVIRDGEKFELKNFEFKPLDYGDGTLRYGIYFGTVEADLGVKLEYTWNTAMNFSRWVWMGLKQLVSGAVRLDDMAGPVGIVDMMNTAGKEAESAAVAADNLLYISAFIAINLAIMNMLPIPALDGGRVFLLIVSLVIEAITRKKLDPKYEGYIHAAGLFLLLGLMAVIMYNDIAKLVMR